jgi:cobalt-zinc-cadmium efflux system protein
VSAEHQHDHPHHHHAHHHAPPRHDLAFAVGIALNVAFVIVEAVFGSLAHSVALVADATHNLGDVLGLGLAWGASVLARWQPSSRRTYGWRGTTILAALANAVLLLVAVGGVAWEAIKRLMGPPAGVEGWTMLVVAAVGVAVNSASALFFLRDRKTDANIRGAFLHLMMDAAVSLGVVLAGAVILRTGWTWLDPAVSLVVSLVVLVGTWRLLRSAIDLALHAVPEQIDPKEVRAFLARLPGVIEVHDLHIWAMSTTEIALTAHLVMPGNSCSPRFLHDVCASLQDKFEIGHATLQVDPDEAPLPCALAPEHTV